MSTKYCWLTTIATLPAQSLRHWCRWQVPARRVPVARGEYCFVEGKNGSRRNVAGFRSQENLIQINRSSAARSPAALPESFVPRAFW
jgi:hypothetical protein